MYAFRSVGLPLDKCGVFSYMVGLGLSTVAGRFHYVTNLTLKAQGWAGEWDWLANSISDGNDNGSGHHIFPNLRVLHIDLTENKYPSYKLLDVEKV